MEYYLTVKLKKIIFSKVLKVAKKIEFSIIKIQEGFTYKKSKISYRKKHCNKKIA